MDHDNIEELRQELEADLELRPVQAAHVVNTLSHYIDLFSLENFEDNADSLG